MDSRVGKIKVTIIDDNKGLVEAIKQFLELRNFSVNFAYSGYNGLKVIELKKPHLIILDLLLPDVDGKEVLTELKKNEETKDIPVIILTGRGSESDREYGLELGADAYVSKPYHAGILLRHIAAALDKEKEG